LAARRAANHDDAGLTADQKDSAPSRAPVHDVQMNHRGPDVCMAEQRLYGSDGRRLLLQGATLLHVAAEFGNVEAARLLLDRGADIAARATVDDAGDRAVRTGARNTCGVQGLSPVRTRLRRPRVPSEVQRLRDTRRGPPAAVAGRRL
jgi:hypothetical protein